MNLKMKVKYVFFSIGLQVIFFFVITQCHLLGFAN